MGWNCYRTFRERDEPWRREKMQAWINKARRMEIKTILQMMTRGETLGRLYPPKQRIYVGRSERKG